jgi:hypothetical protein
MSQTDPHRSGTHQWFNWNFPIFHWEVVYAGSVAPFCFQQGALYLYLCYIKWPFAYWIIHFYSRHVIYADCSTKKKKWFIIELLASYVYCSSTLSFPGTTFCSPARARTKKKCTAVTMTHTAHHARLRTQQHFCQWRFPKRITCIMASMSIWVACECIPFWSRTGDEQVRDVFYVLRTTILCLTTVISRRAFLLHFPLLLGSSSAASTLHDTTRP